MIGASLSMVKVHYFPSLESRGEGQRLGKDISKLSDGQVNSNFLYHYYIKNCIFAMYFTFPVLFTI